MKIEENLVVYSTIHDGSNFLQIIGNLDWFGQ